MGYRLENMPARPVLSDVDREAERIGTLLNRLSHRTDFSAGF